MYTYTVRYRYNAANFHTNHQKDIPQLAHKGDV